MSRKKSVEKKVDDIPDLLNSMIIQIEKEIEKDEKKVDTKKKSKPQPQQTPPTYQNGTSLTSSSKVVVNKTAKKRKYSSNNTTSVDSSDSEVFGSSPQKSPKLANLSNNENGETNSLLLTKKQNGKITNGHHHKVTNKTNGHQEEDMDVENIENNSNKTKKSSTTNRKRTTSSAAKDEAATKNGFLPGFIQINETCVAQRQKERIEQNCRCLDLQTHYPNRTTTDLSMCRECCAALSSPDNHDVVNVCCRFEGWRLLRIDKQTNELKADGFLGLDDAKEHDNELWSLGKPTTPPPSEDERKVCAKLLETIGKDFRSLIAYELEMAKDYTKEVVVWKRQLKNVRDVCDQCGTTIFNGHFVCEICGFQVCLNCQELRIKNKTLIDMPPVKTQNSKCDEMKWIYCYRVSKNGKKSKTTHEPKNLVYVQYILPHVIKNIFWTFNEYMKEVENLKASKQQTTSSESKQTSSKSKQTSSKSKKTSSKSKQTSSESNKFPMSGVPKHGRFLLLDCANANMDEQLLNEAFEKHWPEFKPIVIKNVHKRLDSSLWKPSAFDHDFGQIPVNLMNCKNNKILSSKFPMHEFWDGFDDESNRIMDPLTKEPLILKLKDWPTTEDFKNLLPSRYNDLMNNFPVRRLTSREGQLNLVSYVPEIFCVPDLGPKLYVAYSSALTPKEGTTDLHVDVSDAFNLLIHASNIVNKKDDSTKKCNKSLLEILENSGCSKDQIQRYKKGEIPGALWHVFKPSDASEIRTCLVKKRLMKGKTVRNDSDAIHDQINYIDDQMLKTLKEEHNVTAHVIIQFLGDAIFLPSGAPHQVRNLNSCIKVALDFVSAEGVEQCLVITEQLRRLSERHSNREDKLQIKNIIYHTVKKCLTTLIDK